MRRYCLIVALAFVAASASDSSGQSRRPSQGQDAQSSQQNAYPNDKGTEQAPFVIKILPAEQAKEKSDTTVEKGLQKPENAWGLSDKIAVIASVVAFLQFLALVATVWVMLRTGRHQLRAYVLPHDCGVYEGMQLNPPQPGHSNEPGIVLNFKNSGQTPAYKVISWARVDVIDSINEDKLSVPALVEQFTLKFLALTL